MSKSRKKIRRGPRVHWATKRIYKQWAMAVVIELTLASILAIEVYRLWITFKGE